MKVDSLERTLEQKVSLFRFSLYICSRHITEQIIIFHLYIQWMSFECFHCCTPHQCIFELPQIKRGMFFDLCVTEQRDRGADEDLWWADCQNGKKLAASQCPHPTYEEKTCIKDVQALVKELMDFRVVSRLMFMCVQESTGTASSYSLCTFWCVSVSYCIGVQSFRNAPSDFWVRMTVRV